MRYYDLLLYEPNTTKVVRRWTSHPASGFDPQALNIHFDIITAQYGTPVGLQTITLEGPALSDLAQNTNYMGLDFVLKGGMQAGLPLANPKQAGVITAGRIFQSFGNWEGTDMALSFVVSPSQYSSDVPGNFVLNWKAGTELSSALKQTLQVAYPDKKIGIHIKSGLVQQHDCIHYCATLEQLGQLIYQLTDKRFSNPVGISIQAGEVVVSDSSYIPATVQIAWTDFVGQPTWIDVNKIQMKTIMRADLLLGGTVKMPQGMQSNPGIALTTEASYASQHKYKSAFQNDFTIQETRQIGNYRSASGDAWVTVTNCVLNS